jgi:hypothetical protein
VDRQVDPITSFGADSLESALRDNWVSRTSISSLDQKKEIKMGFDQYHEPPEELSQEMRTFARMITSLIEEAEAIGWYEQRMSLEKDKEAKAIMANAQKEEFKHFGMNLEFLLRRNKDWRTELQSILFTTGDIVKQGEAAEKKVD